MVTTDSYKTVFTKVLKLYLPINSINRIKLTEQAAIATTADSCRFHPSRAPGAEGISNGATHPALARPDESSRTKKRLNAVTHRKCGWLRRPERREPGPNLG
jgi:hypothetical protein